MEHMSMIYDALLEKHAEMVMDDAMRAFAKKRLYHDIDEALRTNDRAAFLTLSKKLKTFQGDCSS